jgi:hypothetical protein
MRQVTFEEIVDQHNKLLAESRRLDFIVRDKELQETQVKKLNEFRGYLKSYKQQAAQRSDEALANIFFHLQCVINAQMSSLKIWISIKDGKHQDAWNHLIDAQEYVAYAIQTSDGHDTLDELAKRLDSVEHLVFPGFPVYSSLGLIFTGGVCSICDRPIEECEHLEGRIYWGKVCQRIRIEKVDIGHSAIVPNPKDRRCIITEWAADDGFVHDYISWKVLRSADQEKETGRHASMVLLTLGDIDIY